MDRDKARQLVAKTRANVLLRKQAGPTDSRLQTALLASEQWISRGLNSMPIKVRQQIIVDAFRAADAAKSRDSKWIAETVAWTTATVGEINTATNTWRAQFMRNSASFQKWAKGIAPRL